MQERGWRHALACMKRALAPNWCPVFLLFDETSLARTEE